jgi:hypothetical protein
LFVCHQASKGTKTKEQLEKEQKTKEYRQAVLLKHGQVPATSRPKPPSGSGPPSGSSKKPAKPGAAGTTSSGESKAPSSSKFQELFDKRTQGFQIDFLFRNAPPRPPVGPCFVGANQNLDGALQKLSRHYNATNAVETNHVWKLHNDGSLTSHPLAPAALNPRLYGTAREPGDIPLHPDDAHLLEWTNGNMGDSMAELAHRRKEEARAAARLVASGQSPAKLLLKSKQQQRAGVIAPAAAVATAGSNANNKKKMFSRVLKDDIQQPWMKKTTYLSNDYSRKVHDFKSLARTKKEMAIELAEQQQELNARRSALAVKHSFNTSKPLVHPHKKSLQPKRVMNVLPNTTSWGRSYTHVVIDKAPTSMPDGVTINHLTQSFVTNVHRSDASSRYACAVQVPAPDATTTTETATTVPNKVPMYRPAFAYDLDVVALRQQDTPDVNFCFLIEKDLHGNDVVTYIPIASRLLLTTGRPAKKNIPHPLERRPLTDQEKEEMEERMAEVDRDMAEKHHITNKRRRRDNDDEDSDESEAHLGPSPKKAATTMTTTTAEQRVANDDGENDYADSDSDDD